MTMTNDGVASSERRTPSGGSSVSPAAMPKALPPKGLTPSEDESRKASRRGKRGGTGRQDDAQAPRGDQRCARQGCTRPRGSKPGFAHCSLVCAAIYSELNRAERFCRWAGPSETTAEIWTTAVELGDLLSKYQALSDQARSDKRRQQKARYQPPQAGGVRPSAAS